MTVVKRELWDLAQCILDDCTESSRYGVDYYLRLLVRLQSKEVFAAYSERSISRFIIEVLYLVKGWYKTPNSRELLHELREHLNEDDKNYLQSILNPRT